MHTILRSTVYILAIAWVWSFALPSIAVEPRIVSTDVGRYAIHEFEDLPAGAVELSQDGKFLFFDDKSQVSCYQLPELDKAVGTVAISKAGNWKIVGSELIVGGTEEWTIYSIPTLSMLRSVPLPPHLPKTWAEPVTNEPEAVDDGWYVRGLLYSPDTSRVLGTKRGWLSGAWVNLDSYFDVRRSGNCSQFEPRLPGFADHVELTPNGFRILGVDLIPYPMQDEDNAQFARCGDGWMSVYVTQGFPRSKPCHVIVQVLEMKGEKCALPDSQFRLAQPSLVLDPKVSWQQPTLDGGVVTEPQMVSFPSLSRDGLVIPESYQEKFSSMGESGQPWQVGGQLHWMFPNWRVLTSELRLAKSRLELENLINERYLNIAKAEFELVVGRAATNVPISIYIRVQDQQRSLDYFVWTEITKDELMCGFSDKTWTDIDEENLREPRNEQIREKERRSKLSSDVAAANRRLTEQVQAERNAAVSFLFGVISCGIFFLLGCISVGLLIFTSSSSKSRLALLLVVALPTQLFGQAKWTIESGNEVVKQVVTIPLVGTKHDIKVGFMSGIGLLKYDSALGKTTLMSVNLKAAQRIATAEFPAQWDWESTIVGGKYAACLQGDTLQVLDVATCKIASQAKVREKGQMVILFDKALWLAPNLWFALPSLKPVTQHPIVDPGAMARLRFGQSAAPRMTSSELCIIDGIEFDSNLRETGKFYGHAVEMGPNRSAGPRPLTFVVPKSNSYRTKDRNKDKGKDKSKEKVSEKEPEPWKMTCVLQDEGTSDVPYVKVPANQKTLSATSPKKFSATPKKPCRLWPFQGGLWSLGDEPDPTLFVIQLQDEYQLLTHRAYPNIEATFSRATATAETSFLWTNGTPLESPYYFKFAWLNRHILSIETRRPISLPLLPEPRNSSRNTADLLGRFEPVASPSKPGQCQYAPAASLLAELDRPSVIGQYLVEQVCILGGMRPTDDWETIVANYRKHTAHWIKFAPEALRNDVSLLPVEIGLTPTNETGFSSGRRSGFEVGAPGSESTTTDIYCGSIVFFLREAKLRSQFEALRVNAPALPLPTLTASEFSKQIRELEAREIKRDIPPELKLEPLPEFQEPQLVNPASIVAQLDNSYTLQYLLLPLGVIMRMFFLLIALAANNKAQPTESDKIKLPGNYLGIFLVALAWFSLEYSIGYVVGFVLGFLLGAGLLMQLTVYLVAMLISLTLIFGLLVLATRRSFDDVSKVALGAFTIVAVTSLRSLRGLF